MTFVTVGNATQPFPRLLDAVQRLARDLPEPLVIQWGNNPSFASTFGARRPFLPPDEFERHIQEARLVISHGGAGTVLHALAADKVPVVMPRQARYGEHIDDHQRELVEALARMGRVVPAWEAADLPDAVGEALARKDGPPPSRPNGLVRVVREWLDESSKRSRA